MHNVEFRVSAVGNERVKESKQRNVHAYMVADNYSNKAKTGKNELAELTRITYNPHKHNTFINAETGVPVTKAAFAVAVNGKVYIK